MVWFDIVQLKGLSMYEEMKDESKTSDENC